MIGSSPFSRRRWTPLAPWLTRCTRARTAGPWAPPAPATTSWPPPGAPRWTARLSDVLPARVACAAASCTALLLRASQPSLTKRLDSKYPARRPSLPPLHPPNTFHTFHPCHPCRSSMGDGEYGEAAAGGSAAPRGSGQVSHPTGSVCKGLRVRLSLRMPAALLVDCHTVAPACFTHLFLLRPPTSPACAALRQPPCGWCGGGG